MHGIQFQKISGAEQKRNACGIWNDVKQAERQGKKEYRSLSSNYQLVIFAYICNVLIYDSFAPYQFRNCFSKFEAFGYKCTLIGATYIMHFNAFYGILPLRKHIEAELSEPWGAHSGSINAAGKGRNDDNGNTWLKGNTAVSSVAGIWCGKDLASEMLFSWPRSGQQHNIAEIVFYFLHVDGRVPEVLRGIVVKSSSATNQVLGTTWLVWVFWVWMNHEPLAAADVYLHPPIWTTPEGSTGTFRFRICGFLHPSHHIIAEVPCSDHWDVYSLDANECSPNLTCFDLFEFEHRTKSSIHQYLAHLCTLHQNSNIHKSVWLKFWSHDFEYVATWLGSRAKVCHASPIGPSTSTPMWRWLKMGEGCGLCLSGL